MQANKHGLGCFANNSTRWFASVSADNQLKLWDTTSNVLSQQYTNKEHFSHSFTSIALSPVSEAKGKDSPEGLVALGAENGTIVVFGLGKGEVTLKLGGPGSADGHSGTIHHLVFNEQATILYSCSQDKSVIEWDLQTGAVLYRYKGGKTGVTCLCLSPDGSRLVSAGTSLKMWDLSSKKVLRKFAGHSTSVTCLAFSPDGAYIASGAEDRFVNMWSTTADVATSEAKSERSSVQTFTMDSSPLSLHFNPFTAFSKKKSQSKYYISAVSVNGQGSIWEWAAPSKKGAAELSTVTTAGCVFNMPAPAKVAPEVDGKDGKKRKRKASGQSSVNGMGDQDVLLGLRFTSQTEVLVARGTTAYPKCQIMEYRNEDGLKATLDMTPVSGGGRLHLKQAQEGRGKTTASIVVSSEATASGRQASKVDAGDRIKRARSEYTLAELISATTDIEQTQEHSKLASGVSNAASLVSILTQALHTGDNSLIDYCLREGGRSEKVVVGTVERLPSKFVRPLLDAIVNRYRAKPSRGVYLMAWIRQLLNTHTSYLMSVGEACESLSTLYQSVNRRLSVNKKLQHLEGRLELVLAQVSQQSSKTNASRGSDGPMATFTVENEVEEDDKQSEEVSEDSEEGEESA